MLCRDCINREGPKGSRVLLQRHAPLCGVLRVAPFHLLCLDVFVRRFAEGRDFGGLYKRERIAAFGEGRSARGGFPASMGKRDLPRCRRAEALFPLLAVIPVEENP